MAGVIHMAPVIASTATGASAKLDRVFMLILDFRGYLLWSEV
jgi:hypothetical protein